ncbi:MAG: hypothetical protein LJE68_09195 [Rhodobacter sp.]|nr:hypothetical protein [Rhodobacter sp.]
MRWLAVVICALPGLATAEGRNDPFLDCRFEGGRQVTLAENGDLVDWIEDDFQGPTHCTSGTTVICVTQHPEWGPQTLVVTAGTSETEERMRIMPGTALLTTVWFGPNLMSLNLDNGLCQRIGR